MNPTVFTINFIWLPFDWEHQKDAGSRTVRWSHVPRTGDQLRLLLSREATGEAEESEGDPKPVAVRVTFRVTRVIWAPDGLATTVAEVLLQPTDEAVSIPVSELAEQIAAQQRSDTVRSLATRVLASLARCHLTQRTPACEIEPADAAAIAAGSETES